MITVSNNFKTAMKQPIKELDAYINTENIHIQSNNDLISFKISCEAGLCKTAMRKLEAKYLGEHNLLGQWVTVGFGVKLPNGVYEYLNYGSFLVSEITYNKDTGVTEIVGYDKMINTMTKYSKLEVNYPIDLYDYTKLLCNQCGLELGTEKSTEITLPNNQPFNICPIDINAWETGSYSRDYNRHLIEVDENTYCIRLKKLIEVKPNTNYRLNILQPPYTPNSKYRFYYYELDSSGVKVCRDQQISNANERITTTENTKYITAYISKKDTTGTQDDTTLTFDDYIELFSNGGLTPYINAFYKTELNNEMFKWEITRELWENINGITYRDILVQIAQATGTTCIIGNDDKVYLKPITKTGEDLTYANLKKLKFEPIYGEINSVVLSRTPVEDNIYMRDEESIATNGLTEFKIENNEIIDKNRDNAITPIYNMLHGITYYPFESTTEGLGWYEIGDSFRIKDIYNKYYNCVLFNFSITIDGSIKEVLKTKAETKSQTQYQYATTIEKRVTNTEITVNKQEQYIEGLVSDMYEENGLVHGNFTKVYQDINNIVNNVQNSGGNNLIQNSVMFAYDDKGIPSNWTVGDTGTLIINSSAEALSNGGLSGHIFTLSNKIVKQRVYVKQDNDSETNKTYYTFSTKIKKDTTGTCYIKIYNDKEEHIIELKAGENSFYKDYELKGLLPKSNYYDIEFYGSADSNATFTDNMLAVGEYKTQWTQANGEIMNTQVNVNIDGVLVKSSIYLGDYTVMSPLEFAGYSNINGIVTKVFSLNKDTTLVKKLESEDEVKMVPIKIVPITTGDLQGWAFVPST